MVQSYLSKLAPKTLLRMASTLGDKGVPGNVHQAFNILIKQLLKSFRSTEVKKRTFSKRIIMGYTSEIVKCSSFAWATYAPQYFDSHPP